MNWVCSNRRRKAQYGGTDNRLIEAFIGRLRAECLNTNWFLSLDDAKEKVEK